MARDQYNALKAAYAAYEKATGGDPRYRRNLVTFEDAFQGGDKLFIDEDEGANSPGKQAAKDAQE